jgi:hypothetical protein
MKRIHGSALRLAVDVPLFIRATARLGALLVTVTSSAVAADPAPISSPVVDSRMACILSAGSEARQPGPGAAVELRLFQATGVVLGARRQAGETVGYGRLDLAVLDVDYVQLVPWIEQRLGGQRSRAMGATLALPLFAPWLPARLDGTFVTLDASLPMRPLAHAVDLFVGVEWFVP